MTRLNLLIFMAVAALAIGVVLFAVLDDREAPGRSASPPLELVRGVYGGGSSAEDFTRIRSAGFDSVYLVPSPRDPGRYLADQLDELLNRGLRALVWLGPFNRDSCSFERSQGWVEEVVIAARSHPAVLAYQLADEPDRARRECPEVTSLLAERSDLVRSLEPEAVTYISLSAWDGASAFAYERFTETADVFGLVVYPCSRAAPRCRYELIDAAVAAAEEAGIERYWAIIQDFSDGYYRSPTPSEVRLQFRYWRRSDMEGYFVYHWNIGDIASRPDHLAVFREENRHRRATEVPRPR
jgi:hypothetical protein